jgi:hypothetical protein
MMRQSTRWRALFLPLIAASLAGCETFPAGDMVASSWNDPTVLIVNRAQRPIANLWDDSGDDYITVAINRDASPVCVGLYYANSTSRFIRMWRVEPNSERVLYPHEAPEGTYNRGRMNPGESCPENGT